MWSRIKHWAIPISIKLTILYAVILSFILLFTSLLTVAGLYYVLYTQADDDVHLSAVSVTQYLYDGKPIDGHLLNANLLMPGVMLRVFDDQNELLIDSAPYIAGNRTLSEEDKENINPLKFTPLNKRPLRIVDLNGSFFYYADQVIWQEGRSYQLTFMKPMAEQTHFFTTLIKSLLVTNLIGLLFAIISGLYISRKILHPIRGITATAKEIEINDLGKRIKTTDSNDELQELARTFNHMLNRIQSGFEQQRRFVSDASHELRTPITVLIGYADMLDRWGKQDPAALEEGIGAIKSEASNMYGLIEKLLFLARTDQSKQIINKKAVEMNPIIAEIVQETRMIAQNHQIELAQNDLTAVYADSSYIKEMLRIFIENSIKYTPTGGTIRISSMKTSHYLTVTIQDTGIGIPKEEQIKIFDRFYRVDKSRSKITGGTGLGLSIAHWIAEQHKTTINVFSNPGEGTTVTVQIPLRSPQEVL
jgi:signal transduction histidine kinase